MTEYFVVYSTETGTDLWRGSVPEGHAAKQSLPEGAALLRVPMEAIAGPQVDLSVVRSAMQAAIDAQAEAIRATLMTPGAGQAMVYSVKVAEAQAVSAASGTATPILDTEAAALGVPVAELACQVIAAHAQWLAINARIEASRPATKTAIAAAETIGAIAAASAVDWVEVISDAG